MDNEIIGKAINLAASYYAEWQACNAAHEHYEARDYRNKYDGALNVIMLLYGEDADIDKNEIEAKIKDTAYGLYGDEIKKIYETNNASW